MSEPYVAEIRIFAGNFAPRGWSLCNGQTLPISQNTALFSLVGTTYGGDGRTTLGLPNLQGRIPMHAGTGPGLTPRKLGSVGGQESVKLITSQMPQHRHGVKVTLQSANEDDPLADAYLGKAASATAKLYSPATATFNATMNAAAVPERFGDGSHTNMQPFTVLLYIIALTGIYPSRS